MKKYETRRITMSLVAVNLRFGALLGGLRTNRRKCFEYAFANDLTPVRSKIIKQKFCDPRSNRPIPGAFEYVYVLEYHP